MKKRISTIIVTLALLVPLGSVALASHGGAHATQTFRCSPAYGSPPVRAYLYEHRNTQHDDGDDRLAICFNTTTSIPDFTAIAHTLPGNCADDFILGSGDWEGCVSSWQLNIPSGYIACLYTSANYVGLLNSSAPGPGWSYQFNVIDDAANSFRVRAGSTC